MLPIILDIPGAPSLVELALCVTCGGGLAGRSTCHRCGTAFRQSSGYLEAIGHLTGNNRIAAAFYDSPNWRRFRPLERLFLGMVGGRKRARREILRHLPDRPGARILEVGIGDGENLDLLDDQATIYGVDIAKTQLAECLRRFPAMSGRLSWSEGERLPFPDHSFDAAFTVGGFNYFSSPEQAAEEMRRVTRPGGVVLIADERPDLKRFGLGHLLRLPAFDAWWMRRLGLPADFVQMVLRTEIDPDSILDHLSRDARRLSIWKGLGYLLVDTNPSGRRK